MNVNIIRYKYIFRNKYEFELHNLQNKVNYDNQHNAC